MLSKRVFDSLTGNLQESYRIPGVENAYANGAFCMEQYCRIREAYDSLCKRLGQEDEDPDVETIIHSYMQIEEYIGLRMFEYGVRFGEKITDIFELT